MDSHQLQQIPICFYLSLSLSLIFISLLFLNFYGRGMEESCGES